MKKSPNQSIFPPQRKPAPGQVKKNLQVPEIRDTEIPDFPGERLVA